MYNILFNPKYTQILIKTSRSGWNPEKPYNWPKFIMDIVLLYFLMQLYEILLVYWNIKSSGQYIAGTSALFIVVEGYYHIPLTAACGYQNTSPIWKDVLQTLKSLEDLTLLFSQQSEIWLHVYSEEQKVLRKSVPSSWSIN